jgi:subtilisin family serine protease
LSTDSVGLKGTKSIDTVSLSNINLYRMKLIEIKTLSSGMIDDQGICFLIARVFDAEGGVRSSIVLNAIDWAIDEGAKIINLSLGGGGYSWTAEQVLIDAYNSGALVFASAG